MKFIELFANDREGISKMSHMATEIVREHFDPIIGKAQNDYMISLFQTEESISTQLQNGYRYFFIEDNDKTIGFTAFYPRDNAMYLSKFYLYKEERGKGYSRKMLEFIIRESKLLNLNGIELNVNKENDACLAYEHLGFQIIRAEKNDIGNGFIMDDYVYRLDIS